MNDKPRRGPRIDPLVQAREEAVYGILENRATSKDIAAALGISVPAVRLSLKRLRSKGAVSLHKVDGIFLWSRTAKD